MCVDVWMCERREELVAVGQRILDFSWFTAWRLRNRILDFSWQHFVVGKRILDFSWSKFCWFFIFFCLNLSIDFYRTKVAKFFGGYKIMEKVLLPQGWFPKWFFLSQILLFFVLKIKTSIQEFLTFDKPIICFI